MGTALNVCLVYENLYVQKIKIRNIRIIPELRYNYYYYIDDEIGVRVYVLLLYNDCHVSHDCLYNVSSYYIMIVMYHMIAYTMCYNYYILCLYR